MDKEELETAIEQSKLDESQIRILLESALLPEIMGYEKVQLDVCLNEESEPEKILHCLQGWDRAAAVRTSYSGPDLGPSAISTPTVRGGDDPDDDRWKKGNPYQYPPRS